MLGAQVTWYHDGTAKIGLSSCLWRQADNIRTGHSATGIQQLACSDRHSYDQPGRIMVMMGIITFRWLIFDVCFRFFNTLVVRTRLMAFNVKFNFTLFIMYVEYRNLARTPMCMNHMKHRRPNSPGHSRAVPAYFIWSHHVRSAEVSDLEIDGNWKLLNKERNARAMLSVSCQQLLCQMNVL